MGGGHDFRDNGQPCPFPGVAEQLQPLGPQALEGVGRGPGLESPPAQEGGSRRFDVGGHGLNLFLAFHRAGTGYQRQTPAPDDGAAPQIDNGIVGVKFPVGLFIRLLYPLDALDNVLGGDIFDIHLGGVAQQAEHYRVFAIPGIDLHAVLFGQLGGEFLHLLGGDAGLEYDNHDGFLAFLCRGHCRWWVWRQPAGRPLRLYLRERRQKRRGSCP